MAYFAGWELIDDRWVPRTPGADPNYDWTISIAETVMCYITIVKEGHRHDYFLGTNPALFYGSEADSLPTQHEVKLIGFFQSRYPEQASQITDFLYTYISYPTDTEPTFDSRCRDGIQLLVEWCRVLKINPPPI